MKKIISLHIPKSGGKTFIGILRGLYGQQFWKDNYDIPHTGNFRYHLDREVDCIHGHFRYDKYKHMNRETITWLRHPVERMISQYYWQKGKNTGKRDPHQRRLLSENMSLVEFAEIKGNVMTEVYLQGHTDFAFIGIMEDYNNSLLRFSDFIERKISMDYVYENKGEKGVVLKSDRTKLELILEKDINYYHKTLENIK